MRWDTITMASAKFCVQQIIKVIMEWVTNLCQSHPTYISGGGGIIHFSTGGVSYLEENGWLFNRHTKERGHCHDSSHHTASTPYICKMQLQYGLLLPFVIDPLSFQASILIQVAYKDLFISISIAQYAQEQVVLISIAISSKLLLFLYSKSNEPYTADFLCSVER